MAIDFKDFMHGAALIAIADSDDFTALNKASLKYGHYVVNHDRHIFVKYAAGTGPKDYNFNFQKSDKRQILQTAPGGHVFAVLVCGDEVITAISREDVEQLIDLEDDRADAIKVSAQPNMKLRITGGGLQLPLVARNSFPGRILDKRD
jgi:hypothetical protein